MDNRESYRTRGTFIFHFQIGGRARSGELCFCFRCRAQKRTDTLPRVRIVARRAECAETHMLFIVCVVIGLIAFVIIPRMRVPGGVNSANLGWMSEQWLTEHRASHSL